MDIRSLVAIAALAVSLPALALADPLGPGRGFEDRLDRHAEELGLDDETRAKIEALVEQSRPAERARRELMRRERDRLSDLLSQTEPDLEAVLAQADAISRLESEELKSRLRTTVEVRALLTPEQRAQLVSRTNELRGVHERRRLERLRDVQRACSDEIAGTCEGLVDDPRSLRRCLMGSESVSPACAEQLFEGPGGRRRGPLRRPF